MRRLALVAAIAAMPFAAALPAAAMTPGTGLAGIVAADIAPDGAIVAVRDGCGPGGHRTPYGRCVPNYYRPYYAPPPRPFYRPCPPGFHFGPRAGRCFPNY